MSLRGLQSADLESILHPIAKQLDAFARGVCGVKVAGMPTSQVLHAYVLQFPTNVPGGDKFLDATGRKGAYPNGFREISGALFGRR